MNAYTKHTKYTRLVGFFIALTAIPAFGNVLMDPNLSMDQFGDNNAFRSIADAIHSTPDVNATCQKKGFGKIVKQSVYQAVKALENAGIGCLGTEDTIYCDTPIVPLAAGTASSAQDQFTSGLLGGYAGTEIGRIIVDAVFLSESYLYDLKIQLAREIGADIKNATGQPDKSLAAANQRDWAENLVSSDLQRIENIGFSDLQQRFTNAAFLSNTGVASIGSSGLIRAQLIWHNTADLDLHMILPGGAGHLYYGNSTINFNGGQATAKLDHDNLGGTIDVAPDLRVENIAVTGTAIPAGLYQVYAYVFSANGNATISYQLTATGDSTLGTQTLTGTFTATGQTSSTINVNSPGGSY